MRAPTLAAISWSPPPLSKAVSLSNKSTGYEYIVNEPGGAVALPNWFETPTVFAPSDAAKGVVQVNVDSLATSTLPATTPEKLATVFAVAPRANAEPVIVTTCAALAKALLRDIPLTAGEPLRTNKISIAEAAPLASSTKTLRLDELGEILGLTLMTNVEPIAGESKDNPAAVAPLAETATCQSNASPSGSVALNVSCSDAPIGSV